MTLHSMKNHTTGFSANMMMLGRDTIQPLYLMIGQINFSPFEANDLVKNLIEEMAEIHYIARESVGQTQLRQKNDYDLMQNERFFSPGDPVYLRDSATKVGVSAKVRSPWAGAFIITSCDHPLYKIESHKKSFVIHHDRLKLCQDSHLPLWLKGQRHSILNLDPDFEDPDSTSGINIMSPELDTRDEGIDQDRTLPYMIPDKPDIVSQANESFPDLESDEPLFPVRTTGGGREIKKPSRFL